MSEGVENRREAAIGALRWFFEDRGFPVPEILETGDGDCVMLTASSPDGKAYKIGYSK